MICKTATGCHKPAIAQNHGYCEDHATYFLLFENDIGSLALGVEFMRGNSAKLCDCGRKMRHTIGYANLGMFRFPASAEHIQQWCQALGMDSELQNTVSWDPSQYRLAYWHFFEEHRFCNSTGNWELDRSIRDFQQAVAGWCSTFAIS
jgi:hypothetical protein